MNEPELLAHFERYAEISLHGKAEELARFYAPRFIFAGPQGSACFDNDAAFLTWLQQVQEFNLQSGMTGMRPLSAASQSLSPMHLLASVRWAARFEKTGDRDVEFDLSYLLEAGESGFKILAYVSKDDQESEMKRLGLL